MFKVVLFLLLLFFALLLLRLARFFFAAVFGGAVGRRRERKAAPIEGEMVRDPICGVWIDRRLALSGGGGVGAVAFCSEECLRAATRRRPVA